MSVERLRSALRRVRGGGTTAQALAGFPFPSWIESPPPGTTGPARSLLVRGYVAVPRTATLAAPTVVAGPFRAETDREQRPEIRPGFRNRQILAFRRLVTFSAESAGHPVELEVRVNDEAWRAPLGVTVAADTGNVARARAARLDAVEPMLRCPRLAESGQYSSVCRGALTRRQNMLQCVRCGATYSADDRHFDFLGPELRALATADATGNVSSWGYDPIATDVIKRCANGWVLDAGSGLKETTEPNVVNLEIVNYPTTDVLAVGESLPFADQSFDGVLSLCVLEHVRDPFRCAAELARVVRPGGAIYAAVPFLQPYHGYPHHYYNMTDAGLRNLFESSFSVDQAGTPPYGWPIWSLSWYINSFLAGLSAEDGRTVPGPRTVCRRARARPVGGWRESRAGPRVRSGR